MQYSLPLSSDLSSHGEASSPSNVCNSNASVFFLGIGIAMLTCETFP